MPTWYITGSSTGLGRALASAALEDGHNVVITARDPETIEDLVKAHPDTALGLGVNVTDRSQIIESVQEAEKRFGAIDVLVNNAGYGYRAAVEEADDADVERLFATNFFGPVALIQAVLPAMRARRSGAIVNISSIGARTSPPGSGFYAATKAALEAMTASLRKEIGPLGITAMVVEPGAFRTDFAGRSLTQSQDAIADYAPTAGQRRKEHDTAHGKQAGDPAKAARAILDAVAADDPPFMLVLGPDALNNFRNALAGLGSDADVWASTSTATDFDQ